MVSVMNSICAWVYKRPYTDTPPCEIATSGRGVYIYWRTSRWPTMVQCLFTLDCTTCACSGVSVIHTPLPVRYVIDIHTSVNVDIHTSDWYQADIL